MTISSNIGKVLVQPPSKKSGTFIQRPLGAALLKKQLQLKGIGEHYGLPAFRTNGNDPDWQTEQFGNPI